ncbi:MAG: isoprenylcysteine carboxylmethyltransferase family protein [Firmicutes bacterium]|nr:isoprenylcysteine carboxylmethyltransferase family protein [Bacillota bacterium]
MVFRHLLSLVLPITAAVLVPGAILWDRSRHTLDLGLNPSAAAAALGLLVLLAGLLLLAVTVWTLVCIGKGTLAPWDPTLNLVVSGVYGHVRNPMISGVLAVLLGESLIFGSPGIFAWFVIFFLINQFYIRSLEEPGLVKRFGEEYLEYRANVPMWIPRVRPWAPGKGKRE